MHLRMYKKSKIAIVLEVEIFLNSHNIIFQTVCPASSVVKLVDVA